MSMAMALMTSLGYDALPTVNLMLASCCLAHQEDSVPTSTSTLNGSNGFKINGTTHMTNQAFSQFSRRCQWRWL